MAETGTRPSTLPEWATDVGATVEEPLTAKKKEGWVPDEIPPPGWFNWWQELVYDWIYYMSQGYIRVFDALETAYDSLAAGEIGLVSEGLTEGFLVDVYGGEPDTKGATTDNSYAIEADGKYVYVGCPNRFMVFDRDGNELNQWTYGGAATVKGISSDGTNVFVATTQNYVEAYNCETAATSSGKPATTGVWAGGVYDHTADVNCVYTDGQYVFAAGAADGAGDEIVRLNYSTGAKDAGFSWGSAAEEVHCIQAYNGDRVYVGGDYSAANTCCAAALEYDLSDWYTGPTTIDAKWEGDKDLTVYAVAVDKNHVYFGGTEFQLADDPQTASVIPNNYNDTVYYLGVKCRYGTYISRYLSDSSAAVSEITLALTTLLNAQLPANTVLVTDSTTKIDFASEDDYGFELVFGGEDSGNACWQTPTGNPSPPKKETPFTDRSTNVWAFRHDMYGAYFDYTRAPVWTLLLGNYTKVVYGLVSDGEHLYVATDYTASHAHVYAVNPHNGAVVDSVTIAGSADDGGSIDAFSVATDQFRLYVGHSRLDTTDYYYTCYNIKQSAGLVQKQTTTDETRCPLHNGILIADRR